MNKTILVTGGAGFIGSHYIKYVLNNTDFFVRVLDCLTYAANPQTIKDLENNPCFEFIEGSICDPIKVKEAMRGVVYVVNFAAETHVDNSIIKAENFIKTNVLGVDVLLKEAIRAKVKKFHQVSTDEVYGHLPDMREHFTLQSPLNPRNPYSATKAASEHLVTSYNNTYGLPTSITRGSNTYGTHQHPEKLVPKTITTFLKGEPMTVHGSGEQVRDWLSAEDHAAGIHTTLMPGKNGCAYNIGGNQELTNLNIIKMFADKMGISIPFVFVRDRPGHDFRYALDNSETTADLGWKPQKRLEKEIDGLIRWYSQNPEWLKYFQT